MKIEKELIERLLYEEEGDDLDFKKGQYRFIKATDEDKSEILKDIISFANGWRRADAYILIGVEEKPGKKSEIIGILDNEKLDDAQLQQFVNQKIQKPIQFSYRNLEIDGKCIGVIHIPIQARPFYLKKDYGKLKKETVYVRRGSSTDVAEIDEISKMGVPLLATNETLYPELEIFFSDPKKREILPDLLEIECLFIKLPNKKDIPDFEDDDTNHPFSLNYVNRGYYRELSLFTLADRLYSKINFSVKNIGAVSAQDVRVEIVIKAPDNVIMVCDESNYPDEPKMYHVMNSVISSRLNGRVEYDLTVNKIEDYWLVQASLDKVQPRSIGWINCNLYVGSSESTEIILEAKCYSDNLSEPAAKRLIIKSKAQKKNVSLNDVLDLEKDRFLKSDKYRKYLEDQGAQ